MAEIVYFWETLEQNPQDLETQWIKKAKWGGDKDDFSLLVTCTASSQRWENAADECTCPLRAACCSLEVGLMATIDSIKENPPYKPALRGWSFPRGFMCVWGGAGLGRWKVVTSKRVHYTRWVSSHKYLLQVSLLCSLPCPSSWVSSSLSFLFPPFHKTASLHPYSPLSDAQKCTSPQALLPHRFILSAVSVILRWLHSCSANKILKLKDPSPL